jgi:hypothetical protein
MVRGNYEARNQVKLHEASSKQCGQTLKQLRNGEEDYNCWLRALDHTNSVYINDAYVYYDLLHGYGRNY